MSEQGYEYDQYAPQTNGRLFSSSMFGFNKEEVLEYLDELADENYQRQEAAELQIQELTQRLHHLEATAAGYQQAGQEQAAGMVDQTVYDQSQQQAHQLAEDLDVAKSATQQAEEDLAEIREQLFNAQQENNWLREEFQKADVQMADLRRQLDDASQGQWVDHTETERQIAELKSQLEQAQADTQKAQQEKEAALAAARNAKATAPSTSVSAAIIADANAEADRIRAVANDEKDRIRRQIRSSAGGLAQSVTNLRGDLTGVEGDVTHVLEAVQASLSEILSALSRTEQNLNTLGVQVERFPAASASVPTPPQQQVVYFQPTSRPVASTPPQRGAGKRAAAMPESYGQGGFRRVGAEQGGGLSNTRPFRPAYSSSPTAEAPYWPPDAEAYPQEEASEERIRALAENLADTLVQMLT